MTEKAPTRAARVMIWFNADFTLPTRAPVIETCAGDVFGEQRSI